jgi:Tfp pilus assembly protein PilV
MRKLKHLLADQKGQTMVEILIAMTVVTVVMVAVVSRAIDAVKSAQFARNKSLATRYAQEGVEWGRLQRDAMGWESFSGLLTAGSIQQYCLIDITADIDSMTVDACGSGDEITGTHFQRQVDLTLTDVAGENDYVYVEVRVSWEDAIGTHNARLQTNLSEWSK